MFSLFQVKRSLYNTGKTKRHHCIRKDRESQKNDNYHNYQDRKKGIYIWSRCIRMKKGRKVVYIEKKEKATYNKSHQQAWDHHQKAKPDDNFVFPNCYPCLLKYSSIFHNLSYSHSIVAGGLLAPQP